MLGKASVGIMVAAKQCGGDVNHWKLQSAIAHAKSMQLPKEKIEDALSRGMMAAASSKGGGSGNNNNTNDLKSMRYDAMLNVGGGGTTTSKVACIITALSDNRNRTAASVRHAVTKEGCGELMATDSLSYLFQHVGQIVVNIVRPPPPPPQDEEVVEEVDQEEALLECALEAGATNVEPYDDDDDDYEDSHEGKDKDKGSSSSSSTFLVTTVDTELFHVVTALRAVPTYDVVRFEHRYILQDPVHGGVVLSPEGEDQLMAFLDKMDENEDVTNVYHNAI